MNPLIGLVNLDENRKRNSGDSLESIGVCEIANMYSDSVCHIIITCNKNGKLAKRTQGHSNSLLICFDEKTNDQGLAMTAYFSNMIIAGQICAQAQSTELYKNDLSRLMRGRIY
ncbi:MAG: D-galactosamine 6-phosphate deaminase/isomerase [Candidatus Atribacteria bacterium]|nr:D-galactosamine 6-phosphate deaminase/isomerase [Candidatus Atribacteria bacterium]